MTGLGLSASSDARDAMEKRAAEFLQRRCFWDWSEDDQALLDAWLAESVLHRVTYLRLQSGTSHIERWATLRVSKSGPDGIAVRRKTWNRRFVFPLLAAAAILAVAVAAFPIVQSLLQPADRAFSTEVGGRALLKFADGTEIDLNTDTAVRYRMTTHQRLVWLDKGEAYFRVSHDAAHPFAVIVGDHRVTDLGTEFLVRRETAGLDVALMKGRAQVSGGAANARIAMLAPGDEAHVTATSAVIKRKTVQQLSDKLAWQQGVLVFRNTPLADAVREFNRYNQIKLVIADPSISGLKIGGEFRTTHTDDFLELAQAVFKLHVQRTGSEILLSRSVGEASRAADGKRGQ